jgi:N-acylneuraminate cytidylyltransferase
MNAAIITARKGSKDKNVWPVDGKPIVWYPMNAAWGSLLINEVYVSTDSQAVKDVARGAIVDVIERPPELATDEANHGHAIVHAVDQLPDYIENVVVLLGNSVMVESSHISRALEMLEERPGIDSVMSVMPLEDLHPSRSHILTNGVIEMWDDRGEAISTNRQDYVPTYAFDGRLWAFRRETPKLSSFIQPWFWMGRKCAPLILPAPPVRDVHDELEVEISEWWVSRRNNA